MRMDLTVDSYETFADLDGYVYGSAAVIGLMVTPDPGTGRPDGPGAAPTRPTWESPSS